MAGKNVGELAVIVGANVDEFKRGMAEMKAGVADANKEIGKMERDFKKSFGNIEKQIRSAGIAMAGIGTVVFGGLFKATKDTGELGEELLNLNKKTGISVEALSELKYMADTSGASLASVETAIKQMNNALDDSMKSTAKDTNAFKRLGLSLEELKKLKPDERFWQIAEALAEVKDEGERSALAVDIFGKSGTDLIPILDAGQEGLQAMKDKARELGVVMSQESAEKAAAFNESMDNMGKSLEGLKNAIGKAMEGPLGKLVDQLTSIITKVGEWADAHPGLVEAIGTLAGALAIGGTFLVGLTYAFDMFSKLNIAWTTAKTLLPEITRLLGTGTTGLAGALGYVGLALAGIAGWWIAIDNIVKNFESWTELMKQAPWQTLMNLIKYGSLLPGSDVKLTDKAKESLGKAGYTPGSLPGYASGGIVTSPTLAMVGESGPEAIIPLPDIQPNGGGTVINLTVQGDLVTEGQIIDRIGKALAAKQRRNFFGPSNLGYGYGTSSV